MLAKFPEKLAFLWEPRRYKILYGGRGGAKSWGVARALLLQGASQPLRILCTRELQNSIADSVHKLLSDQIAALDLGGEYEILKSTIKGRNGTEFVFAGIKNNVNSIKSFEGFDRVWVEEAQAVSRRSWEVLIPTIRKEGSEIWVTFNPELESDETYQRFVVRPYENSIVTKVNYSDNPFLPRVLREEMETLKGRDFEAYLNVWEGHCLKALSGSIYEKEIAAATLGNRITRVPYDPTRPVSTYWDLGVDDSTSIWFAQSVAFEYRIIDFYENSGHGLPHYLQQLQSRPYIYGTAHLPHDGRARQLGTGKSIEELMRATGFKVEIVAKLSVEDGINACRTIFSQCWFDEQGTADGMQHLRHYRYDVDAELEILKRKPRHDAHSHAADAWRTFGVAALPEKLKSAHQVSFVPSYSQNLSIGWMR